MLQSQIIRKDGRKNLELQDLVIVNDMKKNCTSSVYFETNNLKLLCSINGPIYSLSSKTENNIAKMQIKINIKFPTYLGDNLSRSELETYKMNLESVLLNLYSQTILTEKYAKTILEINIDIIEFNCDITNYAIMAVSLALNYASIEQKGLVSCSNIIILDDRVIVDPTLEEEKRGQFKLVLGSIIDLKETNVYLQKGKTDENNLKMSIATSLKVCESYRNYLVEKL